MEEQEKKCTWTGKKATEGCTGAPECLGKSEAICKRMMQQEGKCSWTPPTCAPLFGKSDLRQKGQWCYHVKKTNVVGHRRHVLPFSASRICGKRANGATMSR